MGNVPGEAEETRCRTCDTVLISRKPFTEADLARAREGIRIAGFETIYLPGLQLRNPFNELLLTQDLRGFQERYPFNIRPVDDDRPFFFYTVQPRDFSSFFGYFFRGDDIAVVGGGVGASKYPAARRSISPARPR